MTSLDEMSGFISGIFKFQYGSPSLRHVKFVRKVIIPKLPLFFSLMSFET